MLGLGYPELIVIGLVALVVIGPRRLPELLRRAGRISAQIRRAANEFRRELEMAVEDEVPAIDAKNVSGSPAHPGASGASAESAPPRGAGGPKA